MGRFDMLALHTYMLARRMVAEGDDICRALNQEIFDLFVADIDRALRELGIGDTSVPKRKKKMVRSFYGQIEDFDAPLDARNRMVLEQRIVERYFSGASDGDARHLARYMLETDQALRDQPVADLLSGELTWPDIVCDERTIAPALDYTGQARAIRP